MADQATETQAAPAQAEQKPEIIELDKEWPADLPADLPTKYSKTERFDLYESIAEKEHTIIIGGSENQGVFTPLLRRFPELVVEVEGLWYEAKKAELKLCVSIYHGIINTNKTTFDKNGKLLGPGQSEHRIKELYDRWHRSIRGAAAGKDPMLAKALPRGPSRVRPLAMENGLSLQQIQPKAHAGLRAPGRVIYWGAENDDDHSLLSVSGAIGAATPSNQRQNQRPGHSRKTINQQNTQINGIQAPVMSSQIQPNNQMAPTSAVPTVTAGQQAYTPIPNRTPSGNHSNQIIGQGTQMQMPSGNGLGTVRMQLGIPSAHGSQPLNWQSMQTSIPSALPQKRTQTQNFMPAADVFNLMNFQTPTRFPAQSGNGFGGAVPMDGVVFTPSRKSSNNANVPGQASVPQQLPSGFQAPTGYRPRTLNSGTTHPGFAYSSNQAGTTPAQTSAPATNNNGSGQINFQTNQSFAMQANAFPQSQSQGGGMQAPSMNLQGMQNASWNLQVGQPMTQGNTFASGPTPPKSGFQTPVTPATPFQNSPPTQQSSNAKADYLAHLKARCNKTTQDFSLDDDERKLIQRYYNAVSNAIGANDYRTREEFEGKIECLEKKHHAKRARQQRSSSIRVEESGQNEVQAPQNVGTPSVSVQPSALQNQVQNQNSSTVQVTPNNSAPTQPVLDRPYTVPLEPEQWEPHYELLRNDCERRIQKRNLDEKDGKSLRHIYGEFLKARKAGDESQAIAAQHVIETFPGRRRRGSKSLTEVPIEAQVAASAGPGQSGLQEPASSASHGMSGHSTNGQFMNEQLTNDQFMADQALNGQPTNDQLMNSQPINAQDVQQMDLSNQMYTEVRKFKSLQVELFAEKNSQTSTKASTDTFTKIKDKIESRANTRMPNRQSQTDSSQHTSTQHKYYVE